MPRKRPAGGRRSTGKANAAKLTGPRLPQADGSEAADAEEEVTADLLRSSNQQD